MEGVEAGRMDGGVKREGQMEGRMDGGKPICRQGRRFDGGGGREKWRNGGGTNVGREGCLKDGCREGRRREWKTICFVYTTCKLSIVYPTFSSLALPRSLACSSGVS